MISGLSSREFLLMQQFIEKNCGISIEEDKAYLIESKLSFLLAQTGLSSFEELYLRICDNTDETITDSVIDAITINETFWFRDKLPWKILEEILLPSYVKELREGKRTKVRIWSTACSYGQEPYSIAMCIDNYLKCFNIADVCLSQFEIIATDISKEALSMALAARYDNISVSRGLMDNYKAVYFSNAGRVWSLCEEIKNSVQFKHFNLQNDFSSLGKFDIIFCRNVLIYFSEKLKNEVVKNVASSLEKDGVLIIGSSELLADSEKKYRTEQYENGVYYKLKE